MKFKKKPLVIEAIQWLKIGDHHKVIRLNGKYNCKECGQIEDQHGWILTLDGGHIVCPNDWIIKGIKGEFYPCKPDIFNMTYDLVEENKVGEK